MALPSPSSDHLAAERRATLATRALRRAWRGTPPATALTVEELATITPHLHATGTSGLAWWALKDDADLAATRDGHALRESFRTIALHTGLHELRLAKVLDVADATGIEPLLLKGWSMARAYPSPGLRPCGDVDLAVPADDHARFASALANRDVDRDWINVDLEHRFLSADGTPLEVLLQRSQRVALGDRHVRIAGPADQLRLVCVHYLRAGGWSLRALCDVALLLDTAPRDLDWDVALGDHRHRQWVSVAAGLAADLLGADLSGTPLVGAESKVPAWVRTHVLRGLGTTAMDHDDGHLPPFRATLNPTRLLTQLKARWPDDGLEVTIHHRRRIPRRSSAGSKCFDVAYRAVAFAAPVAMRRARRDGSPELAR
jgi:hypothetical protein